MTKQLRNGNLTVELDSSQYFPNDPGNGTPVMVIYGWPVWKASASYNCAVNEGVLSGCGQNPDYELSEAQMLWLDCLENKIEEFFERCVAP